MENKWKDAVEQAVKKDAPLRLEVGKKYRTASGEIVKIVENDGSAIPFKSDKGKWYRPFSVGAKDPIVAPVEDEPAKAEEPPQRLLRLEVGKKYRNGFGKIVTIIEEDKTSICEFRFHGDNGYWYKDCGQANSSEYKAAIVALVEDEPAKAKEPKKNPPLAVGQVWRMRSGETATVTEEYRHSEYGLERHDGGGFRLKSNGTSPYDEALDVVEYLGETDRPRIEIGKKYRTQCGEIVRIAKKDWHGDFIGDNGICYRRFGFNLYGNHIVAVVEEEPTKPEEPKKNPPLAVGQIWRTFSGRKATIYLHKDSLFAVCDGGCWPVRADGKSRWDDAELDLVEYIGEANLDPKAEDVVQSKEIPLSEEATMSSKPQDRHESPQQDDRFTQYLIEECARLRDMLEQKDERIDELSRRLMETAQESVCKQKIMFEGILALQMETERQRAADRESLKKDDINALRELCSSNFDAVFEELSSIKESNIETAGDVAAVGGMLAAMQERHECPAPVPATPTAPQEDSLDKGLKLTNRTLTAAQIIWKIIQFTIAFSLFGGAATCAVMMLK